MARGQARRASRRKAELKTRIHSWSAPSRQDPRKCGPKRTNDAPFWSCFLPREEWIDKKGLRREGNAQKMNFQRGRDAHSVRTQGHGIPQRRYTKATNGGREHFQRPVKRQDHHKHAAPSEGRDSQISLVLLKGRTCKENEFSERTRGPLCAAIGSRKTHNERKDAARGGNSFIQRERKKPFSPVSPFRPVTPAGPIR